MTVQQLDEVLHAYGWFRPHPTSRERGNWRVRKDPHHPAPVDKDTMIQIFELAGIRCQTGGWQEGGDDATYITI